MKNTQVVSLKFHKVRHTSPPQHEPGQKPPHPAEKVKERVRSISRVFSRTTSGPPPTQCDLPTQISFDNSETGRLGAKPRSTNSVCSRVFSLESEDGVVITSTRKVLDTSYTKVHSVPSEDGILITSARKVEKHEHDSKASDNSTLSTFMSLSSQEGDDWKKDSDVLSQVQMSDQDALLLAAAKQTVATDPRETVQSKAKNEQEKEGTEARNISMFDSLCMSEKVGGGYTNDLKDEETSILHKISVAVGQCPLRLCFEGDSGPACHEGEDIFVKDAPDDMSSLSGI